MKTVWITALGNNPEPVQKLMETLRPYGIDANGKFWNDDLQRLGWLDHCPSLADSATGLWIILGSPADFAIQSIRYGLSLLSLNVNAQRKTGLPVLCAVTGGETAGIPDMPSPFRNDILVPADSVSLGAKVTARLHTPFIPAPVDYRLSVYARPEYGVWFEVGPSLGSTWDGALFGIDNGEIDFHAVGNAAGLPERTFLEYEQRGLELSSQGKTFYAWAVRNRISAEQSYYIRVRGVPGLILFGPYSTEDEALVTLLTLS